jgi:deoxyribonuclease V
MSTSADFLELPDLKGTLRDLLRQIPRGRVTTYGALADALGNRIAARWVGQFLLDHEHGAKCPCHRVVRVDGSLGEYIAGGAAAKAKRLTDDKVEVQKGTVDLASHGFDGFKSDRPLERLRQIQEALAGKVTWKTHHRLPMMVGGVDVSYASPSEGVAAYALVEAHTGRLAWSTTARGPVTFPYISSYLSFRELPLMLEVIERARRANKLSEVVLVDGSGLLHQRRAGIATHLGVVAGIRTLGVTKKLLCGQIDPAAPETDQCRLIRHETRVLGIAMRTRPGGRHLIYLSPGHLLNTTFVKRFGPLMMLGHKLPEPLYWADLLSREAAGNEPIESESE